METSRIAVIGGGVSGLAVAYELRRAAPENGKKLDIHIFESMPHIGGNAESVVVSLGKRKSGCNSDGEEFTRWADLGVNDINLTAYKQVARVMKEIEFYDKDDQEKWPNMRPLENTETFFDDDSRLLVTDDQDLCHGVSNPDFELATLDEGKQGARFWINILFAAAQEMSWQNGKPDLDLTVGDFFDAVVKRPRAMLEKYTKAAGETIDWEDNNLVIVLRNLAKLYFLPRIAAMYFADDAGPENMLLAAPMCYYRTQEGRGTQEGQFCKEKTADRRYFVGGSISWLNKLQQNLLASEQQNASVNITVRDNFRARIRLTPDQIEILNGDEPGGNVTDCGETFDRCIVTVHADDAARSLEFDDACSKQENAVVKTLRKVRYTHSEAYCHSYAGLLPADRNQWRCYNVPIRNRYSVYKGYSMTYVCNRHQNDAQDSPHTKVLNRAGMPQFFVTLNPQREIPEKYILPQADTNRIPLGIDPETVKSGPGSEPGVFHLRKKPGDLAVATFKHNLLDRDCFQAQAEICEFNAAARRLFFAGGWSRGSGLQEECWEQAQDVAKRVIATLAKS